MSLPGTGPQLASLSKVSTIDELVNALNPVLAYLGDVGEKLIALDPFSSLAIGLKRFGARGALLTLPSSQGQTTLIAAPAFAELQSYEAICAANNPEGIVAFCEGRLATYPFWLDLDRQSALAYGSMGPQAASLRTAIIDEVLAFVARLPGVERLTFSDGTPFADESTKAWILSCQAERAGGGAGGTTYGAGGGGAGGGTIVNNHPPANGGLGGGGGNQCNGGQPYPSSENPTNKYPGQTYIGCVLGLADFIGGATTGGGGTGAFANYSVNNGRCQDIYVDI
jgi:hypothetical protein